MLSSAVPWSRAVLLGTVLVGCSGRDAPDVVDTDDPDTPDEPAACDPGTQDLDEDGVCHPDCASTPCENGTCDVDLGTGLAVCACDAGYQGDACDELVAPSAADVVFWVDADDGSSITLHDGASSVAAWTDRGPQGLTGATASAIAAPVVLADGANGRQVLRFDGVDDYVTFDGFTGLANTEYTVFAVVRLLEDSAGTLIQGAGTLSDAIEAGASPTSVALYHEPADAQSDVSADSEAYGDEGWGPDAFHLVTFRLRDDDIAVWIDGRSMQASATEGPAKIAEVLSLVLGAREGGGNALNCDIAELIIVPEALDMSGRGPFEDYLGRKWFDAAFPRTPSSFGAAGVWVDASASSTLTLAGGRVTDWQNRGYHGGRFSNGAFPDSRPELVDDAINGLAAVRFDGGDALVQNSLTWPEGGAPYQYTMLAVIVPPSTMSFSGQYLFRANKSNNDANVFEILLAPNALPNGQVVYHHRWPAGDANLDAINVEAAFTGPMLVKVKRSSDAAYDLLAGSETATRAGGPNRNVPSGEQLTWLLGGETIATPGDLALQGDIAELIVLTTALDDGDEAALLGMLREKWGL